MPSLVEVLVGLYVVLGASAFAAVRMHYANRAQLCESRLRNACETALFCVGPVIGAFATGALLGVSEPPLRFAGVPRLWSVGVPYAASVVCVLAFGWNLAEWLHNRRVRHLMTQPAPLPIARAVTLPAREPEFAGFWCTDCRQPHATVFCTRAENTCPECGAEDGCGVPGPHHNWQCSGYQCETCGRIGKGIHLDEGWMAHVCPANAGGDALHGWCVCGEHAEYLKERAA